MAKKKEMIEAQGPFYTVSEKPFEVAAQVFKDVKGKGWTSLEFRLECERRWKEILKQYKGQQS